MGQLRTRLKLLTGILLIVLAVWIAYLPSLSGGFILDDEGLVIDNRIINSAEGLFLSWSSTRAVDYWPMTNTTFWIERRLWDRTAPGYHFTNFVLHIAEALLIWVVLKRLSIPGAFLAAALFAVHPVNVESVAWIAQRKNVLAMLFFLLSILWYLKFLMPATSMGMAPESKPSQGGPREREIARRWLAAKLATAHGPLPTVHCPLFYWLSLAGFILAMLSKGSTAILPVLLLLIVRWIRPLTRRDAMLAAPFFLVAFVLTLVNLWCQARNSSTAIREADFLQRLLGAGGVVWFYLYKAILPINLAFIYPQWRIEIGNPLWRLPLICAMVVTAVLWRYRKTWSGPCLFAWIFFCVALLPVMGFTDVGFMRFALVADHYQHIALIGAVALAGAGWSAWRRKLKRSAIASANLVAIATVGILLFLAWRQNGIYTDAVTLYKAALVKNRDCWMIYDNLGEMLFNAGRFKEAEENLEQALHLQPDSYDAHHNLGNVLVKMGRIEQGMDHYKQALHYKPDYPLGYNSLGSALVQTGRIQEAIEQFKEAIRLEPEFLKAYNNLAMAYVKNNQPTEAITTAQKALDMLRAKQDAVRAKQVEDWLKSYKAGLSRPDYMPNQKKP
jgi:tetratricopeptide (TPR) repeat protein